MKLENLIKIAAPNTVVWDVTVDLEQWPTWTSTVDTIERLEHGPLSVGSTALIKQPGLPKTEWRVSALTPGQGFTWQTQVRGIRMVATHEITEADGHTNNLLRLELYGLTAALLWPCIRGSMSRALQTENVGLKTACQSLLSS